jgi:hypothetical protein
MCSKRVLMHRHRESSSVQRSAWIGTLALVLSTSACDPVRVISVSHELERSPDESCVAKVLRNSEHVSAAGVSREGTVFADLIIPPGLDRPDPAPQILVRESQAKDGKAEFTFYVSWVGAKGSAEYRQYVEMVLTTLQAAAVDACSRSTDH